MKVSGGGHEGAQSALKGTGASTLIAEKEKCLVPPVIERQDHGSADSGAKLVALQGIAGGGKKVASVEDRVTVELKRVTVESIRSRLGDDVDHATGVLSVFSAVVAGLHAELLQSVGKGERRVHIGI